MPTASEGPVNSTLSIVCVALCYCQRERKIELDALRQQGNVMKTRPISRAEARNIDQRAVEELGLPTLILMENAGRGAALWLRSHIEPVNILVLAGPGNNGGDGGVAARHLDAWGYNLRVAWLCGADQLRGDAAFQRDVLTKSGIAQRFFGEEVDADWVREQVASAHWVVDALFGTGLTRPVEGAFREVIDVLNGTGKPVLALDLPSGLDTDTGQVLGTAVRAAATATFVGPKLGFTRPEAQDYLGKVVVCDIGIPRRLLEPYLAEE